LKFGKFTQITVKIQVVFAVVTLACLPTSGTASGTGEWLCPIPFSEFTWGV